MAWLGDPLKINVHNGSKKMKQSPKMKLGEIFLLIWISFILVGLVFQFVNLGMERIGELVFILSFMPSFLAMYLLVCFNFFILIAMSLFFLALLPMYAPDVIHLRGMSITVGFYLFFFLVAYFNECYPANLFSSYKFLRTTFIVDFRNFIDRIVSRQQVAPHTFYSRILYKHLPQYQECLNDIMSNVLNKDYLCHSSLEDLSLQQKNRILDRAEMLNKSGLESGYLLAMLHQYFLPPRNIHEALNRVRSKSIFSNWAEIAVLNYYRDGKEAWQNVLLVYWPNHLGEERE